MHEPNSRVVKVDIQCNRSGKTETIELPLDKVEAFYKAQESKEKATQTISKDFGIVAAEKMPDLIVYFRGRYVVMTNVHPKHDNLINRYLHEVTNSDTAFPKVDVEKKRTRKSVVKETPDT